MNTDILKATKRELLGKKVKRLRTQGEIPAVVYGRDLNSIPITLSRKDFLKTYKDVGESGLIKLKINHQPLVNAIVSEVALHPVTEEILHVNFRRVSLREKITTNVPLTLQGEAPAVKSGEGIVLQLMNELEITCLPQDIPHEIPVDISHLEKIDEAVSVGELSLDRSKIEINTPEEELVVKIDYAQQPEAEEEEAISEEELVESVQAEAERKEEEGETEKATPASEEAPTATSS